MKNIRLENNGNVYGSLILIELSFGIAVEDVGDSSNLTLVIF